MVKAKVKDAGDGDTYEIEVDGRTLYLPRVTTIISQVMSQAKDGMAYWGARLATEYVAAILDFGDGDCSDEEYRDEDDLYAEFKASEWSPRAVLKQAKERGKQAHKLFEKLLKGEVHILYESDSPLLWVEEDGLSWLPMSYDLAVCKAYLNVFSDLGGILSEQRVYSVAHEFAGTADLIAGSVIGDLKTHKPPVRFSDMVQTAAYSLAWEEMTGQHIDTHIVVLAKEDGDYGVAVGYVDPSVFLAVRFIWQAMQGWRTE